GNVFTSLAQRWQLDAMRREPTLELRHHVFVEQRVRDGINRGNRPNLDVLHARRVRRGMHPYLAVTKDARQTRLHAARHLLNVAEEECPAERPVQAASRRNVVEALADIARSPEDELLDV